MNRSCITIACASAALGVAALVMAASAAMAVTAGRTALGGPFVSGGIGESEVAALDAQRDKYSLWVITAAKVSGAYLADVRIRITDAKRTPVLEHTMAGPWLLVELPAGRYDVEASYGGQAFSRATTIHPGDHHQMVIHFDVAADVLPKSPEPAKK